MYDSEKDNQGHNVWPFTQGFSMDVDFCIWALEVDGLQVTPFDKYPGGNGVLRANGMDADSWQRWIKKVVILLDQRLSWHVQDPQGDLSTKLASMENAISQASILFPHWNIPRSNSLNLGGTIGNFHIWQEKHYQETAKVAKLVYKELEHPIRRPLLPYQLWDGDLRIMELLQELWDQFFNTVYSLRQERFFAMEEMPSFINVRRLYELLTPYYTQLAAMQVHFTGYPFSVEYVVAPVSAVVSVPDGINGNTVVERVLQAAENLVALNNI